MNFNRKQAKELSNEKELEIFDNARPPKLNKHTVGELKRLVKRSRTLRDKLTDVKRTQSRSAKSKAGQRGVSASDRTVEKAKLFSEVHDVFIARLGKLEKTAVDNAAKEKAAKIKAAEKKKQAAKKAEIKPRASTGIKKADTKPISLPNDGATRSAKATIASKAAINPELDALNTRQAAARKPTPRAKVIETRIAKGGAPQRHSHASSLNKRKQGKKDSR